MKSRIISETDNKMDKKKDKRVSNSQNPAAKFGGILSVLKEIAQDNDIPLEEMIDCFILYINGKGHEETFKHIGLKGLTPNIIRGLTSYLNRVKKTNKKQENEKNKKLLKKTSKEERELKWSKIEEKIDNDVLAGDKGTKVEIIERIIEEINEDDSEYKFIDDKEKRNIEKRLKNMLYNTKKEETVRKATEEVIQEIIQICEREHEIGNIDDKVRFFEAIKKDIKTGKNGSKLLNIEMDEVAKEHLVQMIDERIDLEKDNKYYEQTKGFTKDFSFLVALSEIERARLGNSGVKFTDKNSYERFCKLRQSVRDGIDECTQIARDGNDEYTQIVKLLQSNDIDDADKRILKSRLEVMNKERAKEQGVR